MGITAGVIDSFEVTGEYSIVETEIPKEYDEQTLQEANLKGVYNIIVLTTIKISGEKNKIGEIKMFSSVQGVASAQTILHHGDVMVLYGNNRDIKKLLTKIGASERKK
ncbi:MAG: hypothetical protein ACQEWD_16045 [Bacteroidota bacterium]